MYIIKIYNKIIENKMELKPNYVHVESKKTKTFELTVLSVLEKE